MFFFGNQLHQSWLFYWELITHIPPPLFKCSIFCTYGIRVYFNLHLFFQPKLQSNFFFLNSIKVSAFDLNFVNINNNWEGGCIIGDQHFFKTLNKQTKKLSSNWIPVTYIQICCFVFLLYIVLRCWLYYIYIYKQIAQSKPSERCCLSSPPPPHHHLNMKKNSPNLFSFFI